MQTFLTDFSRTVSYPVRVEIPDNVTVEFSHGEPYIVGEPLNGTTRQLMSLQVAARCGIVRVVELDKTTA